MMNSPPAQDTMDRVAGTRLGTSWFLPCFGAIAIGIGSLPKTDEGADTRVVWLIVGAVSLATFAWAWIERRRAREFFRWIAEHSSEILSSGLEYQGHIVTSDTSVVQYEVRIGLFVLEAVLFTAPRLGPRPFSPSLVTAMLGWWAIPWGPVHTISAIITNVRGGHSRNIRQILTELSRPEPSKAAWYRRLLALDTGSVVQIAANCAIALILLVLSALILLAIVQGLLHDQR